MQKMLVVGLMMVMCLNVGCSKNKSARQVSPVPMPPGSATGNTYGNYSSTSNTEVSSIGANHEPMSVPGVQAQTSYVASKQSPYIELPAVSMQDGNEPIIQPNATYPADTSMSMPATTYTFSNEPIQATPMPSTIQPMAPVPTPASASAVHVVARGDTLWRIAKQYYNDGKRWTDIARANNISDPNRIVVGMKLTIPR